MYIMSSALKVAQIAISIAIPPHPDALTLQQAVAYIKESFKALHYDNVSIDDRDKAKKIVICQAFEHSAYWGKISPRDLEYLIQRAKAQLRAQEKNHEPVSLGDGRSNQN